MEQVIKHVDVTTSTKDLHTIISQQSERIAELEGIIDQIPGCVYWKDKAGVYLGQNLYSVDNLYGMGVINSQEKGMIQGKTDFDLYRTDVANQFRAHDSEVIENDCVLFKEEYLTLDSGERLIQLSAKQPYRDKDGNLIGVIGNTVNVSYLKKIENDLRIEKQKTENICEEIKNEFMRNMEHDIRTPLNGIIGVADHLYHSESCDERREFLNDIQQCAKELMNYCNTILDFSRIEQGASPVLAKKYSLKNLIEQLIKIEKPAARSKNLELNKHWDEKVPDIVVGDDHRLYRILVNLVGNGIKFTPSGEVNVAVKFSKKLDARTVVLQFIVQDTGVGIPLDKQNYIYEKFTRIEASRKVADMRGIGLGLRVVKQFVAELGGEIELDSEPDHGSTFIVSIPIKLPLVDTLSSA